MEHLVWIFKSGGGFIWPLLALGILHAGAVLGRRWLGNRLDVCLLLWALLASIMLMGISAGIDALSGTLHAMAEPSAEQQLCLMGSGVMKSWHTAEITLVLAIVGLVTTGVLECNRTPLPVKRGSDDS